MSSEPLGYRPALDGVRAAAISLVVAVHTVYFLAPGLRGEVFPSGSIGVDLFFVLSGFLITRLLLERHGAEAHPIARFYARRALRLLPALSVVLVAYLVFCLLRGEGTQGALNSLGAGLTYSTNWVEVLAASIPAQTAHLWSLAVEGQFYLLWPLLLFAGLRLGLSRPRLLAVVLLAALVVAAWRAREWSTGNGWLNLYLRSDTRADALLIGAALALAPLDSVMEGVSQRTRSLLGFGALGLLVLCAQVLQPSSALLPLGAYTAIAGLSAIVVAMAVYPGGAFHAFLAGAGAVALGRISYSLFLWHVPVFATLADLAPTLPAIVKVPAGLALALSFAALSYRYVEMPALRIKSRLRGRGPSVRPGATSRPSLGRIP